MKFETAGPLGESCKLEITLMSAEQKQAVTLLTFSNLLLWQVLSVWIRYSLISVVCLSINKLVISIVA